MSIKAIIKWSAVCCAAVLMSGDLFAQATPMPAQNDEAAWPGEGPGQVRVHPWMKDNRDWFSTIKSSSQNGIVLIGDSLFGNMGFSGESRSSYFPGYKIVNRAIGGDVTRVVLWRLQEDALDLNPKALVVLIGSNDLSGHAKAAWIVANIKAIAEKAAAAKPEMPVILCTIPPRKSAAAPIDNKWLLDVNEGIRGLAGEKNVTVVDLYPLYVGENDEPNPELFEKDLLHFKKPEGYKKLAETLMPVFEKLGLPKN